MASATKRIILSTGWVKIAEAKGRDAMAMIDAYGSVQLAVAEGEPPRGDVASGHSLNGSMMWPVKGAEIIWARGAGVAVSVTLLKVVPEFATLDSAALKVATASAQAVATAAAGAAATADAKAVTADNKATAADAKATEAQAVQARRDFARWYLTDYLHPDDMMAALEGDIAGQDEVRVSDAIRLMHDEMLAWSAQSGGRQAIAIYPCLRLAVCKEAFSETACQTLWDMDGATYGANRFSFRFDNTEFRIKNWQFLASVRTSGYWAHHGITYPVPEVFFRWEQSGGNAYLSSIEGGWSIVGSGSWTDPAAVKLYNMQHLRIAGLHVRGLRNISLMMENVVNSDFDDVNLFNTGWQPTEFGGTLGHMPAAARFSNVGAVVTATQAIFDAQHVGRLFCLSQAGQVDRDMRLNFWAEIASVDSPTQITLAEAPSVNVTDQTGSFEALRASTAGTTWTLSAPVGQSLVGRFVTLGFARFPGASMTNLGSLTTTVISHSGDTITVADAPASDVSNALLILAPQLHVDRLVHAPGVSRTDNVGFTNLRCEGTGYANVAVIPALFGNCSAIEITNAKFHGTGNGNNNYGGTATCLFLGTADGFSFSGWLEQCGNSPRYGAVTVAGNRVRADFYGKLTPYGDGSRSAMTYVDPPAGSTEVQIRWGMVHPSGTFPRASQAAHRFGPNGTPDMVVSIASPPRPTTGAPILTPTRLGEVTATSLRGDAVTQGQTTGSAQVTYPRAMTVGFGGNTGDINPEAVTDLDAIVGRHRRVRISSGPGGDGYVVDAIRQVGNTCIQVGWRIQFDQPPRLIMRHNNNTGGAWGDWYYLDGTILTP